MIKALNTLSPAGKKWISAYNTTHHLTDITRCERVCVCGCVGVWEEGGGGGRYGKKRDYPLLEPIRSQNCKIPPLHELRKKEKVMVNYQLAEEGPCGVNLKTLPSNGDLNSKNLPVGK